jgi:glycine cleavage system H protein
MSDVPSDLKYSDQHEWVRMEGAVVRVGVTAFAQEQLGDIVYVELPAVGAKATATKAFGVVESVKAASDIFCPLSGIVREVNARLMDEPELVNSDPYGDGWIAVIEPTAASELDALMDGAAYALFIEAAGQ